MFMNIRAFFRGLSLALGCSLTTFATADNSVCAPFKGGVVDESIVAEMLAASRDGHLYQIQPGTSRVGFCVDSSIGQVNGDFRKFSGGLTMKPASVDDGRVMVAVDVASLETDSSFIEALLKSEAFFDAEKYPEILFVSKEFKWLNEDEAVLVGELTMHGTTRSVGLHVELVESSSFDSNGLQTVTVKASTAIRRSEFGIYSMQSMASDNVHLCMSVDAVRVES